MRRLVLAGIAVVIAACSSIPFGASTARPQWWAFTAPWDRRSDSSARANASRLDAIVYGWIPLDSSTGQPFDLYADTLSPHAPATVTRMALVTSWHNDRFHPETLRRLASNPGALAAAASGVAARATAHGYRGIVLDLEGMSPLDLPATRAVVAAIADSARAHGVRRVALAIPAL